MSACADAHQERNENASEADQGTSKGKATHFLSNLQHSRYEGVDSEKLVGCISAGPHTQRH